jgi:hypothetical protein
MWCLVLSVNQAGFFCCCSPIGLTSFGSAVVQNKRGGLLNPNNFDLKNESEHVKME